VNISLRAGARLYINGAVIKADRKVTLQLLNDATFLLESHVMQPEEAKSSLRQLYFAMQVALMNPAEGKGIRTAAESMLANLLKAFDNRDVLAGLAQVRGFLDAESYIEALKTLRKLFPIEDAILSGSARHSPQRQGETHVRDFQRDGGRRPGARERQQAGNREL
jgi:flagellar biosynthesis repressor protein FlbT